MEDKFIPLMVTLYIIFIILIIVGNGFGMILIIRKKIMHTVTNLFIISLCSADMLIGVLVIPYTIMSLLGE